MRGQRRALRACISIGCLALAFAITTATILAGLESADLGEPPINLNIARLAARELPRVAGDRAAADAPEHHVVVLGDSTVMSYRPGRRVPERLQEALDRLTAPGDPEIEVVNLAIQGVSAFDYYFLADEIARAEPDVILFAFNLDWLSDAWRSSYSRPELAGLMSARRFFDATSLPLHWVGLSVDELLFYIGIVRVGAFDLWYRLKTEQARVGRAFTAVRDACDVALGGDASRTLDDTILDNLIEELFVANERHPYWRFTEAGIDEHYAGAMQGIDPHHPMLLAFAGAIEAFDEAGIPVFVYLTPANVEYFESRRRLDRAGLAKTIEAIASIARERGAFFLDLHDLLPDVAYRDATGHFLVSDEVDGPKQVADALAKPLLDQIRSRRRTPR